MNNQTAQQLVALISQYFSSGTLAVVIVAVVQWIKDSPLFPKITQDTTRINQVLGAVLAFFASVGVSWGVTGHVVSITFDYIIVLHGLWHWVQQLALQHFVYHGFLKPTILQKQLLDKVTPASNPPVSPAPAPTNLKTNR